MILRLRVEEPVVIQEQSVWSVNGSDDRTEKALLGLLCEARGGAWNATRECKFPPLSSHHHSPRRTRPRSCILGHTLKNRRCFSAFRAYRKHLHTSGRPGRTPVLILLETEESSRRFVASNAFAGSAGHLLQATASLTA